MDVFESDESLREHVIAREQPWSGNIFSVELLEVENEAGERARRETVFHCGGAAAIAVVDGRVCMVKQWRIVLDRMTLEIPAGKLEAGEDPRDCAHRELLEETGIDAAELELIAQVNASPGFTDECTHIYFAKDFSFGSSNPDADELIDVVWLDINEALAAIKDGRITDGKSIVAIFAVAGSLI